ncbi:head-tail connector protein [Dinoroseobacter sp. S76]|uniref:head-tail connector protein n=1 Tax=Dinoroseobacter sp. S76 TaxID=3415124 RepID=UPI003C7EA1C9
MNLTEVSPVPLAALPLEAYRDHLRLGRGFSDDELQDAVLESTLLAAVSAIETRTGKALLRRSFRLRLDNWEAPGVQSFPRGPVQSVAKVALVQADGSETILADGSYYVLADTFRPGIKAVTSFPQVPNGAFVEIRFDAGYGAQWDAIPDSLAQAVLILAAHFYETRDGLGTRGLPRMVRSLIEMFRDIRVFGGRPR